MEESKDKTVFPNIRSDMVIDFHIPKILENLLHNAEEADLRNDGSYDELADFIDVACKDFYADSVLTKEQWSFLVQKYPYPYD